MSLLPELPTQKLQFYLTATYPCNYVDGKVARSQVAIPMHLIGSSVYGRLLQLGFRRSGFHTYRPHCDHCQACVPVRIPVAEFVASRAQRRALKQHQHLQANAHSLLFNLEHYALYRRYQLHRHAGGGMDRDSPEQYTQFLLRSGVDTELVEFRDDSELRMVSVFDRVADGLSAVYTFYAPDLPRSSFGVFGILWQIELCKRLNLPYLYLGYWIAQSPKMAYKIKFQPLEGLVNGRWQKLAPKFETLNPELETRNP